MLGPIKVNMTMTEQQSGSAASLATDPQLSGEPANGTVPSPRIIRKPNRWLSLLLPLYRQHPVLLLIWAIGASWLLYQVSPPFRRQVASTYQVSTAWLDSQQLCGLHGGRATFGPSRHYVMANGVTCSLRDHNGVLSLMQEYRDPSQRGVRFTAEGDR